MQPLYAWLGKRVCLCASNFWRVCICTILWTSFAYSARTLDSPLKECHKQKTSQDAPMQIMLLSSSASLGLYLVCALEGCKQQSTSRKGAVPTSGFVHLEPRTFIVYRCLGISHSMHSNLHSFASCFVVFALLKVAAQHG